MIKGIQRFIDQVAFRLEQGWGFVDAISLTNWLRGVQSGKQREQDRIVSLLEGKICWCVGQPLDVDKNDKEELMKHINCDWEAMMIEYHVSLIKGEQK
jgi:hypothetical protein